MSTRPQPDAASPLRQDDPIPDDPDIETEYRTRYLERDMDTDERLRIGTEMAEAVAEAESLEAQKKQVNSDLKELISVQYEKVGKLAESLRTGTRHGDVTVKVTKNWHTGSIRVVRVDTLAILEERAMTFDERQRTLLDGSRTAKAVGNPSEGRDDHLNPPDMPTPSDHRQPQTIETPISSIDAMAMTARKASHA